MLLRSQPSHLPRIARRRLPCLGHPKETSTSASSILFWFANRRRFALCPRMLTKGSRNRGRKSALLCLRWTDLRLTEHASIRSILFRSGSHLERWRTPKLFHVVARKGRVNCSFAVPVSSSCKCTAILPRASARQALLYSIEYRVASRGRPLCGRRRAFLQTEALHRLFGLSSRRLLL